MPERTSSLTGAPCWIELFTRDTAAARRFYGELFGWTAEDMGPDYGGYINFLHQGARIAGCMLNDGSTGRPDLWTTYLESDDAKVTCAAAESHGGQVVVGPMDVMQLGTMAVLGDAGGAGIGVWQPNEFPGFVTRDEPGTPSWFELHTRDYDASVQFYRDVFGWHTHTMSDASDFRYTTLGEGDDQLAGIMDASTFLPPDVPPHWAIYFEVVDVDATIARATALGGTVVEAAQDTPYGRLAGMTDPTGAYFKLRKG